MAHNGVLRNEAELRKEHKELGITYKSDQEDKSFNDSEALLWDIALTMEGFKDKLDARGTIAFIMLALNEEKGDQLYFGRNSGNPLKMKFKKNKFIFLSSTGNGQLIDTDTLYDLDLTTHKLSKETMEIPQFFYTVPETTKDVRAKQIASHNKPLEFLEFVKDKDTMFWDENNQQLWIKDPVTNEWEEAEEAYAKALQKSNDIDNDTDDLTVEELSKLENCSNVLLSSKGLTYKPEDTDRQLDIRKRFNEYSVHYNDNYDKIRDLVEVDLEWLREQYADEISNKNILAKNLMYEIRVTEGVADMLYMNYLGILDFFDKPKSQIVKTAAREFLDNQRKKKQGMLPLGEDEPIRNDQIDWFKQTAGKLLMANNIKVRA